MKEMLEAAKAAKSKISRLTAGEKNAALNAMADSLISCEKTILDANALDLEAAKGHVSDVMLDRLRLTPERIAGMAKGIREVAELPDPVGLTLESHTRPDGLKIDKVSVPMGVIAIIYESRPNVTSDAAALALKSGNVCILRGGKEAFRSAGAIVNALRAGLKDVGIPETAVNLVQDTSRDSVTALMTANGYVDLLIPRGGAGLISACVRNATVPCIATGTGICHVYVEKTADQEMALNIIENAKTSRPSVCNAEEVLLVDKAIAAEFLPKLHARIGQKVELRLDEEAAKYIPGTPAGERDFDTEFLDYILAVKCVENVQKAVAHIAAHSTGHSEAIVTTDPAAERYFTANVDSAAVYVNASTRFTDGGEFGLGCEMGISTQKLHARGPMGLRELTTYKYIIHGNGQVRL
ncbi:MAG: glutamate-5-semialdehyde dehydrogenase [Firmicutes bacterium]|nr:glutamate-5-semialdehyde dehydrogenase [Clostridiales bacterium]MDD5883269.1 glutamate-5-semialdehyde dehydrogenase [Bacillota bacterium]